MHESYMLSLLNPNMNGKEYGQSLCGTSLVQTNKKRLQQEQFFVYLIQLTPKVMLHYALYIVNGFVFFTV